ncbi:MAG: glycosyltransferase family 9 protein [Ignavibacteria bacterium]|nr:glycosyltransferase family 9 protein [Ignavibacteria bacterium]
MIQQPQSICIIRISSMGDIVLASPLFRILRTAFPKARIDVVVAERFVELVENNPHISNVIALRTDEGITGILQQSREARKSLTSHNYDIVLDLHVNIRSWFFRQLLGKKTYLVDKFRKQKKDLVERKLGLGRHFSTISERYIHTAPSLGIENDKKGLELWLPEEKKLDYYPPERRKSPKGIIPQRIAIAPGARHFTKRWLPNRFAEVAMELSKKYGAEIVLLGGIDDQFQCDEVKNLMTIPVIDATGLGSIIDTVRILDTCDLIICNDSGIMHIAAARQIPVCAIFGSTVREFGFAPFRVRNTVVEANVECRPCTHIGLAKCPQGHFKCMNLVTVENILQSIERDIIPVQSL